MNLNLDNMYGFRKFSVNFSYPKKIVGSTIPNEHLSSKTNFRYRKVNIIMGGNASGKTTLGKAINDIFCFIVLKRQDGLSDSICDKSKVGRFSIDMLFTEDAMYRFEGKIFSKNIKIAFKTYKTNIAKSDSYETCCKKLKGINETGDNAEIKKWVGILL